MQKTSDGIHDGRSRFGGMFGLVFGGGRELRGLALRTLGALEEWVDISFPGWLCAYAGELGGGSMCGGGAGARGRGEYQ